MTVILVALAVLFELQEGLWVRVVRSLNLPSEGGTVGYFVGERGMMQALGALGTAIVCTVALLVSLVFLFDLRVTDLAKLMAAWMCRMAGTAGAAWDARRERHRQIKKEAKILARQRKKLERSMRDQVRYLRGPWRTVRRRPRRRPVPSPNRSRWPPRRRRWSPNPRWFTKR
jgi:hypothetical protein